MLAPALILLFFLLNLSIASRSPFGGWMDEVGYADPGLNLAAGKNWQSDGTFFAYGSPLYPGGLALWASAFGVGMVSARAYCYFLAAIGMLLLWLGTRRFNLLTPAHRLFWIVLLSTEYGMNWMERNERYDVWIFIGMALAWFGASLRAVVPRYLLIFLGAVIIPFSGFVGVPYVCLAAGLAAVLTMGKFWKEAFTAVAGAGSGVIGVFLFYTAFGQLDTFRGTLGRRTMGEESHFHAPLKVFLYPLDDSGVIVMIVLLILLSLYYRKNPSPGALPWLGLGWGFVILMPFTMLLRGVFVMMYFYMLIVPLSLAILQLMIDAPVAPRRQYLVGAVTLGLGILCLGGLPARLYSSWKEWDIRDPQLMREFVRTYVHPDDDILSDYTFYFELRDYAKVVIMPDRIWTLPLDQGHRINVVIMRDADMPDLSHDASPLQKIGGGWKKVAVFPTEEMRTRLRNVPSHDIFSLYRRDVPAP